MTDKMTATMAKIRWMNKADIPEVLKIEHQGFQFPWSEKDFLKQLAKRDMIGLVADSAIPSGETAVVGYAMYQMAPASFHLVNIAVHEDFRRKGIAAGFINKLKAKLTPTRRTRIVAMVSENNLRACKFFKSQKFIAIETVRNYFDQTDWDAYKFQYSLIETPKLEMKNRMGD